MTFWDLFTTPSLQGTFGDLMQVQIGFFLFGVIVGILGSWGDKLLGKKMKKKILLCLFVLLTVAGCASLQTEIIQDPGKIDSITVGRFTTANPVDDELIGSYLRKELSKRGFRVVDDSPYTLTGAIDVNLYSKVVDARIVLRKDTDQIVWSFQGGSEFYKNRKEFARYMVKKIAKQLR